MSETPNEVPQFSLAQNQLGNTRPSGAGDKSSVQSRQEAEIFSLQNQINQLNEKSRAVCSSFETIQITLLICTQMNDEIISKTRETRVLNRQTKDAKARTKQVVFIILSYYSTEN